jgi:ribonucleotide reductase alpha subunit
MEERKNTGRIYLMNVDHANTHGAFIESKAVIKQSNLCAEIALPTKPLNHIFDGVSRKKIRVPKEKYQEFLKYKKESKNLLYLNKERFNGSTGQ